MASSLNKRRTATLLGSILTALSSGTNYYASSDIINNVLNLMIVGVYTTGPILGRIVDKRGPKPLLIAAFLFLLLGYSGLWRYYNAGPLTDDHLPISTLVALSLFSYMTGAGGNCGLAASLNSTAKSFPDHMRATTVGVVLSGFGLSAFYFSALSNWLFPGDTSSFLLFLALGTSLPVIIGFFTVRPVTGITSTEHGNGDSHADEDLNSSSHLLANPGEDIDTVEVVAAYPEVVSAVDIPHSSERRRSVELSPSASRSHSRHLSLDALETIDVHGRQLLKGWEFWLLFSILVFLSGTGLMFINNVGSIAQALSAKGNPDYDRVEAGKLQAAQVSLISLANCAARIGVGKTPSIISPPQKKGTGADVVKTRFGGHRSYLLIVISLLFVASQVIASHIEDTKHLWNASLVLGLGYGGIFGLLPTGTSPKTGDS
ncbi:hypothetical protein Clacol_002055 [Clathrus columnatus]|uniref:Nodulin-like domain-containing protein n=1 Tax=Clathrus columnatus TaxID=1419009 RepID=A0AAV5A3L4_9AGAM|nr:hypothetical protein Clacol_002055 [Clathrus columnatus]